MTWWPLIAAFWAWYVIDCVKASRRARFVFSSWRGGHTKASAGSLHVVPPSPFAWHSLADDLPFSFGPAGVSNHPAAETAWASREPQPDRARAWRWEDIADVRARRGRLHINGADFCALTPLCSAAEFKKLAAACAPLAPQARALLLEKHLRRWFRPANLRRWVIAFRARTATLAALAGINFTLAAAASVYLLTDGPDWIGPEAARLIANATPALALHAALLHFASLVFAWRAHKRLAPAQTEQRLSLILNAALLPPHALRLRAQLAAACSPQRLPLAWAGATADDAAFRTLARNVIASLRWPFPPQPPPGSGAIHAPGNEVSDEIETWMRAAISAETARLLALRGVSEPELRTAPAADGPASCRYCPRCGDQFIDAAAKCPRGVPLQALK